MILQKAKKSGIGTWINSQKHPTLFIVGSTQLKSDAQISRSQNNLSIYHFDWDKQHQYLQQSIRSPTLLSKTSTETSFSSLSWSSFGQDTNKYPAGIIGGGMSDGTIMMWDTQKILDNKTSEKQGVVFSKMIHEKSPVSCLEFNPSKPFLLASAGKSLRINDLRSNLGEQPGDGIYKPGVEKKAESQNLITSLSWHPSIDGYIASTDNLGNVVVWNLKQNKSIYNFKQQAPAPSPFQQQQSEMPASMASTSNPFRTFITWSPLNPTQLVIAGNDSVQSGKLRFWDLRHQSAPTKILDPSLFGYHNLTVDSIKFCKQNSTLLLASCNSGKMALCWDVNSQSIVSVTDSSQYNSQQQQQYQQQEEKQLMQQYSSIRSVLQWSPQLPYVYLHNQIPSNDISIGTVNAQYSGVKQSLGSHAELAKRLTNATPKHYKQNLAFSQSNNGALLIAKNGKEKTQIKLQKPNIGGSLNNILTAHEKQETQNIVNIFFKAQDFERGAGLMLNLNQRLRKDKEIEQWMIIRALLKRDREQSKVELINALGLDNKAIFNDIEKAIGKKAPQRKDSQKNIEVTRNQPPNQSHTIFSQNTAGIPAENEIKNAEDFFANLGSQQESVQKNQRISHTSSNSGFNVLQNSPQADPFKPRRKDSILQTISRNNNWDQGYQGLIKRSLLSNCNASAVQVAFKCGRPAQALMIAKAGGDDLFQKAIEQFFTNNADPFIKYALRAIVHRDIESFVRNTTAMSSSKIKWEEALIMAINSPNNRQTIASQLAHELLNNNRRHQARICFMVAGSFQQVMNLWLLDLSESMQKMQSTNGSRKNFYKMSGLMSRDIAMKAWCLIAALKYNKITPEFDKAILNFVQLCLANGEDNDSALELLDICNSNNPMVAKLYNRILNSNKSKYGQRFNVLPQVKAKSKWPFTEKTQKFIQGNIIKMRMMGQQNKQQQQQANRRNQNMKRNNPQMRNQNMSNNNNNNRNPFSGNTINSQNRGAPPPPQAPHKISHPPPPAPQHNMPSNQDTRNYSGLQGQIFSLLESLMAKYKGIEGNSQRLLDSERKIEMLINSIGNRTLNVRLEEMLKALLIFILNQNYVEAQRQLKQLSGDNEWQYSKDWLPGIRSILNVLSMSYSNSANEKRNMNPTSPFPNNNNVGAPFGGGGGMTQPNTKMQNTGRAPPPPPPPKKTIPPPPPPIVADAPQQDMHQQYVQPPTTQQPNQQYFNQQPTQYWNEGVNPQNQAGSGGGPYHPPPPQQHQQQHPPPPIQPQFRPHQEQAKTAPPPSYAKAGMMGNIMGNPEQASHQFQQQNRGAAPPPPPPKKKGPPPPPPKFR